MSRHAADGCRIAVWPFYNPQRHSFGRSSWQSCRLVTITSLQPALTLIPYLDNRPRWIPATSIARGPPSPQRRSCYLAHQQDGAQDGAADDYAQDEDGEHQDAIQYQSVILWTAQGAELVMADFLRLKIRMCGHQAASPEPHSGEAARLWPKRRHGIREKRITTPSWPDPAEARNGPKVDFC
jgi:hypothetical protein